MIADDRRTFCDLRSAIRDRLRSYGNQPLLRNQRIIPVTNISELVEYVLLPHNVEVIKPRALNTFLDGLAELGVDKRLIKNKKILSDVLEKEKVYRENEGEGDDGSGRSNISDSSEGEESHSENNDVESDSESDQERIIQKESSKPCHHCQNWNMSVTAVVKCPRCFWHDNNSICLRLRHPGRQRAYKRSLCPL